jgi:DNA-binding NarL/FixJ family response regulator
MSATAARPPERAAPSCQAPTDTPLDLPDGSVRALVVDAHALTRIGLGFVLHRQPWVSRCLLADGVESAVPLVERHRPDVAVVEISDAGASIGAYVAPLRAARPEMPLVFATLVGGPGSAQSLGGILGVLTPELSVDQVVAAVRAVVVGDHEALSLRVSRSEVLSVREREVLALLCTGATNREIATALDLGHETVKKHAGSLYRKLGVRNRTEATQRALTLLGRPSPE